MAKRQLRVRNPMTLNAENLRRWLLLNLPKYVDITSPLTISVSSTLYHNFDLIKLNNDVNLFFNVGYTPVNQTLLWKCINLILYIYNVSYLTNREKLKYWKYYASNIELINIATAEGKRLWSTVIHYTNAERRTKWTKWLKDNYEKI